MADRQNIYTIDTNIWENVQIRNQTSILIIGRENHVFPKPDGQTDRHTDGRILVFIE